MRQRGIPGNRRKDRHIPVDAISDIGGDKGLSGSSRGQWPMRPVTTGTGRRRLSPRPLRLLRIRPLLGARLHLPAIPGHVLTRSRAAAQGCRRRVGSVEVMGSPSAAEV